MSRRARALVVLALAAFAFSATACASSPTAPAFHTSACDTAGSHTC